MAMSFLHSTALGVASQFGLAKLPPEFPYSGPEEIRSFHQRSLQDQLAAFSHCGVNWYRVNVPTDACPRCREHAGEEYRVSEAVFGVTAPPFCDHCRCTITPADNE